MNTMIAKTIVIPLLVLAPAFSSPQVQKANKYETWLKEEVVYIMTDREKQVFAKLETDRDRDLFIEEFWRQRDPTPGTPRNEFKDEHFRRIEYANRTFSRGTPFKGRQTERGRIYIILGLPFDVQKIDTGDINPIELWYYHGNPAFGQAPIFRLLFYQPMRGGDYKLYNPIGGRPKDLVPFSARSTQGDAMPQGTRNEPGPELWDQEDLQAYKIIRETISHEAAESLITLIPGNRDFSMMQPSSILLAEVQKYPQKKVNDGYALDILNHKPSVEVSYSVHFMGNQSAVSLLQDPSGRFFLNYVIVPEKLSLEIYQNKYFVDLRTTLRLADPQGKTVFQQERYIPIELQKEEIKAVEKSSFHLYDAVPLVPGMFSVSLLLENTVSKEFTTIEKTVSVPEGNPLWMSPPVLARQIGRDSSAAGASRSFQVGRIQIYPALNNTFRMKDRLIVFLQIYGLSQALKDGGVLGYFLFKDEQVVQSSRKNVREYESGRDFLEEFSLSTAVPGTYVMKAVLWDRNGREVLSQEAPFIVAEKAFPDTWVVAQANPPADDPYYSYVFGTQYLNTGNIAKARAELAQAYEKKPESLEYAVGFARALLLTKEPERARDILLPFSIKDPANFDLYEVLGKACRDTGEFKTAIAWFQKASSLKGNLIEILNPLGECFMNTGDKEQALQVWTRSLQINPNQEAVKKLIEKLK